MAEKTVQFKKIDDPRSKDHNAFECFVAVWFHDGRNVIIGAPTLVALAECWKEITGSVLDRFSAQHSLVCRYDIPVEREGKAK